MSERLWLDPDEVLDDQQDGQAALPIDVPERLVRDVSRNTMPYAERIERGLMIAQPHNGVDRSVPPLALFDVPRPAYHVPSMGEVRATPWNGLTAVSTFSGCGGSSLGLRMAGWRVPYAVEFVPPARATYEANFPGTFVDDRDVRVVTGADILGRLGLTRGELDLLEGSPPCSSFSGMNLYDAARFGSGKVKNYSENIHQRTDDLFDEWLRLVDELGPRAVIAENVPGLLADAIRPFFRHIVDSLEQMGYQVAFGVYKATAFGAATRRRRLLIRGVKRGEGHAPSEPEETLHRHTLGDALETLPVPVPQEEIDHAWGSERMVNEHAELRIGQGHSWRLNMIRCAPDLPLPSITARGHVKGTSDPLHWEEPRLFTATELKWIFGFPADFVLTGTPGQGYERMARCVSPPVYRAHGVTLARNLRGEA